MAYFFELPLITDLTEDQQMALDEVDPIAISGGAGTGKTVVSLWRHIQNMETLNRYSVLVTYTKTLGYYLFMSVRAIENQEKYKVENTISPSSQVFILNRSLFTQDWKVYEIIIDEAQDLTFKNLQHIKNYADYISYGADFNQQLYEYKGVKEDEIKKIFPQNVEYNLYQNFRNTYYILNFIKGILPELHIPQSTLDELKYNEYRIGNRPIMSIVNNFTKEIEKIIEIITKYQNDNIAILLPFGDDRYDGNQSVDKYFFALQDKGILCSRYYNEMHTDNIEIENLHITTFKSSKGLEFDTLIIPQLNKFQNNIENAYTVNEEDYYVAFTRAKTNLYLLSSQKLDFIDNSICEIEFLENNHYNDLEKNINDEIPF